MDTVKKILIPLLGFSILFSATAFAACGNDGKDTQVTVSYEEFGAVGDGKTDDFEAIKQTHKYANENGYKVVADKDACYYIGAHNDTAIIKTDVDWNDADFIIDDTSVTVENRGWHVFEVSSENPSYKVTVPKGYSIKAGQTNLNLTFETDVMLCIVNSNKKDYIRFGKNTNSGSNRQEMILVDGNGNVDESTPVLRDYDEVTSITAYSVTDSAVTVKGGNFTTVANVADISANYYSRGINVKRSNTTLSGISHYITGEGEQGSPYTGFYVVNNANHVTIKDCVLTGHTTYTNIKPTGAVSQGTYDTQAVRSNDVAWINCTQANSVTDTTYWGVMASNFCKNLKMEGCNLSRFDAHQGVYNATIKDTVLGQNLTIIGAGTLHIENVQRLSGTHFMQLRTDYGSTWEGDIILKDCTLTTTSSASYTILAEWNDWDFGYQCFLPETVTLDNFKVEGGKNCYVFSQVTNAKLSEMQKSKNPYVITDTIIIENEVTPLKISSNTSGIFADTKIQ